MAPIPLAWALQAPPVEEAAPGVVPAADAGEVQDVDSSAVPPEAAPAPEEAPAPAVPSVVVEREAPAAVQAAQQRAAAALAALDYTVPAEDSYANAGVACRILRACSVLRVLGGLRWDLKGPWTLSLWLEGHLHLLDEVSKAFF